MAAVTKCRNFIKLQQQKKDDSHLVLMVGLSDIIFLKGNYLWTNPAKFGLICFSGDDFNVIFFIYTRKTCIIGLIG
jgi:hypothetical protein